MIYFIFIVLTLSRVMESNNYIYPESINCGAPESKFVDGMLLFDTLKKLQPFNGLSGEISFDSHGKRANYVFDVVNLEKHGLKKIGEWNSSSGLEISNWHPITGARIQEPNSAVGIVKQRSVRSINNDEMVNRTLIVVIADSKPYGMIKDSKTKLHGNDRYEGFGIELIEKLSMLLGFKFEFKLQKDNNYGKHNLVTNKWDGMLGELNDDRADLAVTDLTITAEREAAFDFTSPFMILGISILFEKPKAEDPDLTSFLKPFSYGVWGCVAASFILVSISLFIAGRMSPEDWENPFPCIEEPEVFHNQLTIKNCLWFSIGSLFQQGSDIAPK